MEMLKIIFSADWEFFSSNWEKCHLNCIGNGALFRPLRHPKKIPEYSDADQPVHHRMQMKLLKSSQNVTFEPPRGKTNNVVSEQV